MTAESYRWLAENTRLGFRAKRKNAWWESYLSASERQTLAGNVFDGPVPLTVARELLDVPVRTYPIEITLSDGRTVTVSDQVMVGRDDTGDMFRTFSDGYQIHPYWETLVNQFLARLVGGHDQLGIGTVQLLRRGAVAYVQVETPESCRDDKSGVEFSPYLYAGTSHDGTIATQCGAGNRIFVCDNTFAAGRAEAAANGRVVKIKHTRWSKLNIENAQQALGILAQAADAMTAELHSMIETEITAKDFALWADEFSGVADLKKDASGEPEPGRARTMAEGRRDSLTALYLNDGRVTPWQGTKFGVLQTANTHRQWLAPISKGAARPERNTLDELSGKLFDDDARALSILDKVLARAA